MEQRVGAKRVITLATAQTQNATMTSSVRSYLSRQHLVTAERLARL